MKDTKHSFTNRLGWYNLNLSAFSIIHAALPNKRGLRLVLDLLGGLSIKPVISSYDSWVNPVNISAASIYLLDMCKP